MRLSANIIVNFANVNQFNYVEQWAIRAGDPNSLYFQLVDLDQANRCGGCDNQRGLRYIAGLGLGIGQTFGVVVTVPSIDNTKILQFQAVQADPNDASIWKIAILPTQIPSSGNVVFQVIEGNATRTFSVQNAMRTELPGADGSC
jgi:hypothetical protein